MALKFPHNEIIFLNFSFLFSRSHSPRASKLKKTLIDFFLFSFSRSRICLSSVKYLTTLNFSSRRFQETRVFLLLFSNLNQKLFLLWEIKRDEMITTLSYQITRKNLKLKHFACRRRLLYFSSHVILSFSLKILLEGKDKQRAKRP